MSTATLSYARSQTMRTAYRNGRAAVATRCDTNPFIQDRDPELYSAWDEGYADELDLQAGILCASVDSSMRDAL